MRHRLLPLNKTLAYPLLAIALSLTLSAFLSPYRHRCFYYWGWYGFTLLSYVLLPYFLMKFWDERKILSLYCASFILVGTYATLQLLFSFFGLHDPFAQQYLFGNIVRANAFCYEPSYYALYMTPFVFLFNAFYLTENEHVAPSPLVLPRSIWSLLLVNSLYILTTSTSIFFAYMAFFGAALFFPAINRRRLISFFLMCTLMLTVLMSLFPFLAKHVFMKFFFQGFMSHHSFYERWVGLTNGWKLFLQHPFFGVGFGGYPSALMEAYLHGKREFLFLSPSLVDAQNPLKLFEAMNVTTELLASLGVIGFSAFMWLLIAVFKEGFKKTTLSPLSSPFLLSLMVTLFVLQFNQGLMRTYLWVHLSLAFAYFEKMRNQMNDQGCVESCCKFQKV